MNDNHSHSSGNPNKRDFSSQYHSEEKKDNELSPPRPEIKSRPLPPRAATTKPSTSTNNSWWLVHWTLNAGLFLLFISFAGIWLLNMIHDELFVPLLDKARRTDEDLVHEYTYYDRHCNVFDVSANATQAQQNLILKKNETSKGAVDKLMTHGAVMIPQLLSDEMISDLRDFVVWKNRVVKGTDSEYPVTENDFRISYGIEATEHPTVIQALKEIHSSQRLSNILKRLVGPRPTLTELTAITSQAGSNHQPWHPDVKPDGNGVQFGRTYAHSYSLFIPLQNVTAKMGATDLCPGTHYCANWIDAQCEVRKIGLHQFRKENVWKAGDATLLNQQVWHRGTQHTDPDAEDRILFIMSFIGAPDDTRQLARGTYFHMKWNMWGHSFQDLVDPEKFMSWPWNVLRCLHLWKPSQIKTWGWDLFTSATMRIANGQLGCEPGDLEIFLKKLDTWGFPSWLDGTIDLNHTQAWQMYFRETIANLLDFFLKINCGVIMAYATALAVCDLVSKSSSRVYWSGLTQLYKTAGIVVILTLLVRTKIQTSPWARDIRSGKRLARPFLPVSPSLETSKTTTQPHRFDILVGTRLSTKSIGAYQQWHEYHPGNRIFLNFVQRHGDLFRSYQKGLPEAFAQELIQRALLIATKQYNGRFLKQDYQTGDWHLMDDQEVYQYVARSLGTENTSLEFLQQAVDLLLDQQRFGWQYRGTALSRISQRYLEEWRTRLVAAPERKSDPKKASSAQASISFFARTVDAPPSLVLPEQVSKTPASSYWSTIPKADFSAFRPLADASYRYLYVDSEEKEVITVPATILAISHGGQAEIALYGEAAYDFDHPTLWIGLDELTPWSPPSSGDSVQASYLGGDEWFPGTITRVRPSGRVDVLYDDGDFETGVWPENYEILSAALQTKKLDPMGKESFSISDSEEYDTMENDEISAEIPGENQEESGEGDDVEIETNEEVEVDAELEDIEEDEYSSDDEDMEYDEESED